MKKIIQNLGDSFINIVAILAYILVIFTGISSMQFSVMAGLGYTIIGIVSVTMIFYVLFILIDIRDSLRAIKSEKSYKE